MSQREPHRARPARCASRSSTRSLSRPRERKLRRVSAEAYDEGTDPMPLQNRVDPFGNLFRTTARGAMMGNRGGALHDSRREIVRPYRSRRWITCVLEFRGRHRTMMTQGRYTELFFLDEAVAFAAGHRPCAECRRESYNAFRAAWQRAFRLAKLPFADEMDLALHAARRGRHGDKVTYEAKLADLTDGCMMAIEERAYLLWRGEFLLWTPEGYGERTSAPRDLVVTVLTPQPVVECFRNGYRPAISPM